MTNLTASILPAQPFFSRRHNGGPALVDPFAGILPDDHKKLFHFAKWHIDDYIAGTTGMSLELEGCYIRFLMRLYQRGQALPDDDRFMSMVMNLSVRVWRRVRDSLISIGKIIVRNCSLTNSRFEREREKRAAELQKQADAAKARWERERLEKKHLAEVSAKLQANLDETSTKISENQAEKSNEINEAAITTHMPLKSPETRDLDRKKDNPLLIPPEEGDAKPRTRKRGDKSRLAVDWVIDPKWQARTKEKFGLNDAQIDKEAERFKRYWTSPDARNPMKADWLATWENWIDRAAERGIRTHAISQKPKTKDEMTAVELRAYYERGGV